MTEERYREPYNPPPKAEKRLVAAIILEEGRLLLIDNIKSGVIRMEPPGGKVEEGETCREALMREVLEELGVEIRIGEHLGAFKTDSPEGAFTVHHYLAEITSGKVRNCEPEKTGTFGWYALEELSPEGGNPYWERLVPNIKESLHDLAEISSRDPAK